MFRHVQSATAGMRQVVEVAETATAIQRHIGGYMTSILGCGSPIRYLYRHLSGVVSVAWFGSLVKTTCGHAMESTSLNSSKSE